MIISYSKKFIFIHIFKTAGTSVSDVLLPHSRFVDRLTYKYFISKKIIFLISKLFNLFDDGQKQFTGFHKHAKAIDIKKKIGKEYSNFFKFCFVRNPYDHLVSLYFYMRQNKNHKYNKIVNELAFSDFLNFYLDTQPETQSDFVFDKKNNLIVDYVGKFEDFNHDFKKILNLIQVDPKSTIPHSNKSLLRLKKPYMKYYVEKDRDLVYNYFKKDFINFDYNKE